LVCADAAEAASKGTAAAANKGAAEAASKNAKPAAAVAILFIFPSCATSLQHCCLFN
jgi:hypothetical protein